MPSNAAVRPRTTVAHTVAQEVANDASERPFVFPAMPPPEEATLARLGEALGAPDETCRALNLGAHDAAEIAELGTHSDTAAIVESVPTIIVSAVTVLSGLDEAQAAHVLLDTGLFAVIVDETVRLVVVRGAYDDALGTAGAATGRRLRTRRGARADAITLRDTVAEGVVRALGPAHAEEVRAAAGAAGNDGDLARGLDGLAGYVERVLTHGSDDDRARLSRHRIGASRVRALRAKAVSVRNMIDAKGALAPRAAHQRALDAQEGRVLVLVRKVVSAMRSARSADGSIPAVQLGRLAALLSPRKSRKKAPTA